MLYLNIYIYRHSNGHLSGNIFSRNLLIDFSFHTEKNFNTL